MSGGDRKRRALLKVKALAEERAKLAVAAAAADRPVDDPAGVPHEATADDVAALRDLLGRESQHEENSVLESAFRTALEHKQVRAEVVRPEFDSGSTTGAEPGGPGREEHK